MKKVGIIKRIFALLLIFLLSINSFAAVVSDNDGSAFITKAEFDSLKNNFQAQIDNYNVSIDSKIDGAIAQYLAGIQIASTTIEALLMSSFGDFDCLVIAGTGALSDNISNCNIHAILHRDYNAASAGSSFCQEYDYAGTAGANSRALFNNEQTSSSGKFANWKGWATDWTETWEFLKVESHPGEHASGVTKKTIGNLGYITKTTSPTLSIKYADHKGSQVYLYMHDDLVAYGGGSADYLLDTYDFTPSFLNAIVWDANVSRDFISLDQTYGFGIGAQTATMLDVWNGRCKQMLWNMDNVGNFGPGYLQSLDGDLTNKGYWPGRAYSSTITKWSQLLNENLASYQDTSSSSFPGVTLYNGIPIYKITNGTATYELFLDTSATTSNSLKLYMGLNSFNISNNRTPVRLSLDGSTWSDYVILNANKSHIYLHPDDTKTAVGKTLWIKWCSTDSTINGGGTVHFGSDDSYMSVTSE